MTSGSDVDDLAEALLVMHGRMRRALLAGKTDDTTASQTAVLGRLVRDGPQSTADLARAEGVRPQSMGATVQALLDLGYVTREADPNDGRRSVVIPTDAGRRAREDAHRNRSHVLTQRLATTNEAERAAIGEALDALGRLLDP